MFTLLKFNKLMECTRLVSHYLIKMRSTETKSNLSIMSSGIKTLEEENLLSLQNALRIKMFRASSINSIPQGTVLMSFY